MSFPDLPFLPDGLPDARVSDMTIEDVLVQANLALFTAGRAVDVVERSDDPHHQLASVTQVAVESRRSTFLIQRLRSRVEGWTVWWEPMQAGMRADPLLAYFHDLRTDFEKRGMPTMMAELRERGSERIIGDAAVRVDRYGVSVAGAARPEFRPDAPDHDPGQPFEYDFGSVVLRNLRLPDPPLVHLGSPLTDFRFSTLARLNLAYLRDAVIEPTSRQFGERPPDR